MILLKKILSNSRVQFGLILIVPFLFQGINYLIGFILKSRFEELSKVFVSCLFLVFCIILIRLFKFSSADIGIKPLKKRFPLHIVSCLLLLGVYILNVIFLIGITGFKQLSNNFVLIFITIIIITFTEEIYFRGIFYGFIEKQYSSKTALVASALFFGFIHFQQGLGLIPKIFIGFAWGSVRYTSSMIFFLIPLHLLYNTLWLVFEGGWNSQSPLMAFILLFDLLSGFAIIYIHRIWTSKKIK